MTRLPNAATVSKHAYALVVMARPVFLLGTLPLYLSGVALAHHEGHDLRVLAAACGLGLVWAVQVMTHYNNEYWDVETDAAIDGSRRVAGGSNVLVEGVVPRATAYAAAVAALALAVALSVGTVVALDVGLGVLALTAVAVAAGWFYSAPPLALASRGVGAVTVGTATGVLVPATAYYLQASTLSAGLWTLCAPLFVLAFATSLATALPDIDADRLAGKRTLAVRLGRRRAVGLLLAAVVVGWGLFGHAVLFGRTGISPATLLVVPVLVAAVARFAPRAAANSVAASERVAVATVANLGWASAAASTPLVL